MGIACESCCFLDCPAAAVLSPSPSSTSFPQAVLHLLTSAACLLFSLSQRMKTFVFVSLDCWAEKVAVTLLLASFQLFRLLVLGLPGNLDGEVDCGKSYTPLSFGGDASPSLGLQHRTRVGKG